MARDLLKLMGNEAFSDVTFQVENRKVPGHTIILAARSDTFRDLFINHNENNALKMIANLVIIATIITHTSFMLILEIIYSNEIWAEPSQR